MLGSFSWIGGGGDVGFLGISRQTIHGKSSTSSSSWSLHCHSITFPTSRQPGLSKWEVLYNRVSCNVCVQKRVYEEYAAVVVVAATAAAAAAQ